MKKLNVFFKSKYGKLALTCLAIVTIVLTMAVGAFAAEASVDNVETISAGITIIFQNVASNFSFTNLVKFLSIAIGSASLLALGWFGLRKVISMIQTALKKGRVRV